MENQKCNPNPSQPYPWYDDRVAAVRKEYANPWADDDDVEEPEQYTPKEIYDYLNKYVWKQDEAKRAASVITYQCLHGIKTNSLVIGPSGSGKTFIFKCLRKLYPSRVVICDGSNLTLTGWKGDKTWSSLLTDPILRSGKNALVVIDEFDKTCTPKYNHNENVSQSIQSEGLTMLEGGIRVDVKDGSVTHSIDTSKISWVFCGAFSNKAHDIAEKSSGSHIGFGAAPKPVQPYVYLLGAVGRVVSGLSADTGGRAGKRCPGQAHSR